jgi:adenylate kinase
LRITITGTPGTGKSTVAKLLAERLKLPLFELSRLVREEKLYSELDDERNALVVDPEKLKSYFENRNAFIAEGLVAHLIPADLLVILRASPETVRKRLAPRNYPPAKVEENVEAERFAVIATEALENPLAERVIHIDTTNRTPEQVAELIERAVKGEEIFEDVDWLETEGNSG